MKAIIFARVSSKDQEENNSIPAQIRRARDYAARMSLNVVNEYPLAESSIFVPSKICFTANCCHLGEFIDKILGNFKSCFTRESAFSWFVTIIVGIMIRSDKLGVTSIIRDLALEPRLYETMLHFFRASSWKLALIRQKWLEAVSAHAPLMKENGYTVLVGDGVKQAKEAKRMPGVKKLFQDSENSSKPGYIFGHMFGGIGVLAGGLIKFFCIPLSLNIQDGLKDILNWNNAGAETSSHTIQMIEKGYEAATVMGNSLLLLDRYFLSVPALVKLKERNASGSVLMEIVTKAKKSCTAYEKPSEKKPGRGRPAKKGAAVKMKELFQTEANNFATIKMPLYGKEETVRYYCTNLLWGQKLYQELRFVLVEYKGVQNILASTELNLPPTAIIRLYSYRFKIECTFREFKQVIGGFSYRFWSKAMPKLKKYLKKGEADPAESVTNEKLRGHIRLTVKAIEGYVQFSCIAMGVIQMLSLNYTGRIQVEKFRYLRTPSKKVVSEATIVKYLQKNIFKLFVKKSNLSIIRLINAKQEKPDVLEEYQVF